MARIPGDETPDGRQRIVELRRRQQQVEEAIRNRDEYARESLDSGLGIRGLARALGIDKTTAQRRYGRGGER